MTKEIYDKAVELSNKVEFYGYLQKVLGASGMKTILNPEIEKKYGTITEELKVGLLPFIDKELEDAKNQFSNL